MNNSLYNNDTQKTGSGEFQMQYRASGIVFENNVVYAGAQGLFIYGLRIGQRCNRQQQRLLHEQFDDEVRVEQEGLYLVRGLPAATGQDKNSVFANPDYLTTATCTSTKESGPPTPITTCSPTPNFDIATSSPAENTGNASLGRAISGQRISMAIPASIQADKSISELLSNDQC